MNCKRLILALLILSLVLVSPACNDTDPVAPDGATLDLSANPANLPEPPIVQRSTITGLLLSSSGTPLAGNQVFFTSDEGSLYQVGSETAESPLIVLTDTNGVARVEFTTIIGTQVNAQSGSARDEVTVTVAGQQVVGTVELEAITSISQPVGAGSTVVFKATVRDTNFLVIEGIPVSIRLDPTTAGLRAPSTRLTDPLGEAEFSVEDVNEDFNIEAQASTVVSVALIVQVVN